VNKYFSDQAIWFETSGIIGDLNDKELLLIKADSSETTHLRIETAAPNSPQRRKVCVAAWNAIVSDEPWEEPTMMSVKVPQFEEIHYSRRFLTEKAVSSIRPRSPKSFELYDVEHIKLELVLEDGEPSS